MYAQAEAGAEAYAYAHAYTDAAPEAAAPAAETAAAVDAEAASYAEWACPCLKCGVLDQAVVVRTVWVLASYRQCLAM